MDIFDATFYLMKWEKEKFYVSSGGNGFRINKELEKYQASFERVSNPMKVADE